MQASSYGKLLVEDFSSYQLSSYPDALNWYSTDGWIINTSGAATVYGTPNASFAGNGVGSGGSNTAPSSAQNDTDEGQGLTTSAALDPENPVVEAGTFNIYFRHAVTVVTFKFINARNITVTLFRNTEAVRIYNILQHGENSVWELGTQSFIVDRGFENITRVQITTTEPSVLAQFQYYNEVRGTSHNDNNIDVVDQHTYVSETEDFENGPSGVSRTQFEHFTIANGYGFDSANPGIHTEFGSPQPVGVGSGGLANGTSPNDTALGTIIILEAGGVPQSGVFTITFRELVYINAITFLNCDHANNQVVLKDESGTTLNTRVIGDYGPNSKVRMSWGGRYRVKSIEVTAVTAMAIASIEYDRREEFNNYQIAYLPDNATTRFSLSKIGTTGAGDVYIIPAFAGGSTGNAMLNKGDSTAAVASVTMVTTLSSAGERIAMEWLAGVSPAIYHTTLRTVPAGDQLEYVCRIDVNQL